MVSEGTDVNYPVSIGTRINNDRTPLVEAVRNSFYDITEYLIENCADVNAHNTGWTP